LIWQFRFVDPYLLSIFIEDVYGVAVLDLGTFCNPGRGGKANKDEEECGGDWVENILSAGLHGTIRCMENGKANASDNRTQPHGYSKNMLYY